MRLAWWFGCAMLVGCAGRAPVATEVASTPGVWECKFDAYHIVPDETSRYRVTCPPGCRNVAGRWYMADTDVYRAKSAVCKAAIHAGLIGDAGGPVIVAFRSESSFRLEKP